MFVEMANLATKPSSCNDGLVDRLGISTDWWRSLDCLFFVLVISFTLHLEYFLGSFKALKELDELCEALGCRVKILDNELLLTLLWE